MTSFATELATPSVTDVRYVRTRTDTLTRLIYKDIYEFLNTIFSTVCIKQHHTDTAVSERRRITSVYGKNVALMCRSCNCVAGYCDRFTGVSVGQSHARVLSATHAAEHELQQIATASPHRVTTVKAFI